MEYKKLRLVAVGTGTALVTNYYNTCFVLDDGENLFLADGGGGDGIYKRFEDLNLDFNRLHYAFLSHEHTDHILGMICVIRKIAHLMRFYSYEGDFTLYMNDVLKDKVESICRMILQPKECELFGKRIFLEVVADQEERQFLDYHVKFFDIRSTKAKQFGFMLECWRGKIVFLGDEPLEESCEKYVDGADWMLSEAFCLTRDFDFYRPDRYHHATVKDAAENAERMGVKNLVLWHTEDETTAGCRKELYAAEAAEYFSGNIYVPDDGDIIEI